MWGTIFKIVASAAAVGAAAYGAKKVYDYYTKKKLEEKLMEEIDEDFKYKLKNATRVKTGENLFTGDVDVVTTDGHKETYEDITVSADVPRNQWVHVYA